MARKKLSWWSVLLVLIPLPLQPAFGASRINDTASATATFAGGCFWCMEHPFDQILGVKKVVVGFSGGTEPNPSYTQVASGVTSHLEAAQITYDPDVLSYAELLDVFWRQIDPTDTGGQFADRGRHYTTAIFYHDDAQKQTALRSKEKLQESRRFTDPIVTQILPFSSFYPAEEEHQQFYRKRPLRYNTYRSHSGRTQFQEHSWRKPETSKKEDEMRQIPSTKPSVEELRRTLTPLQYKVTQENGTEPPFENPYNDNMREGIYVDIVSGEVLFSSTHKFDSGTGWPSFYAPVNTASLAEVKDNSLFMSRTEVRSREVDSHLGHVFLDGSTPTGLRYCINSAALRFIPRTEMESAGYAEWLYLFE
ncbi:MAG: peptide-methionine (R)-S-oxide reductase MsrB [Desulfuromonadaceae bacterium]|nr:peptide-methionine (R)-S-oxide reductase MsrB [Desulfuromonas sp.]MDY0184936.1 peptide-methionine (R)-S-oxide reductase MsrB [Desulfuromonadaceae bacterium]